MLTSKEVKHSRKCMKDIIKLAGGDWKLAKLMEVEPADIKRWLECGVPARYVFKLLALVSSNYSASDFLGEYYGKK